MVISPSEERGRERQGGRMRTSCCLLLLLVVTAEGFEEESVPAESEEVLRTFLGRKGILEEEAFWVGSSW